MSAAFEGEPEEELGSRSESTAIAYNLLFALNGAFVNGSTKVAEIRSHSSVASSLSLFERVEILEGGMNSFSGANEEGDVSSPPHA
jgi:hypothetical protein